MPKENRDVLLIGFDPHAVPGIDAAMFERVINLFRVHAPAAAIAFNTTGENSVDAVLRWLPGR